MTTTTARARGALGMAEPAQAGSELSPIEQRIVDTRSMRATLADALLTSSGIRPETIVRDAITAIRGNPQLAGCERTSFFGSLMTAAQLGLRPNVPTLGHGWIIPRWSSRENCLEAQWQIGYQGMVELAYRSGIVQKITADTIYEGDVYRIRRGTLDVLEHEPTLDVEQRGNVVAHYAVVWLSTGGVAWVALPDADVRTLMERFGPRNRRRELVGPWVSDYPAMARKSALRQLWRFMPKTEILSLALTTDGVTRQASERGDSDGQPIIVHDDQASESETEPSSAPAQPETQNEQQAPASDDHDVAAQHMPAEFDVAPETAPSPFELAEGGARNPLRPTSAREAHAKQIILTHAPQQRVRSTIEQVVGEFVPFVYLTTAELRACAEFRWGDEGVTQ